MKINIGGKGKIPFLNKMAPVAGVEMTKEQVYEVLTIRTLRLFSAKTSNQITRSNVDKFFAAEAGTPVPDDQTEIEAKAAALKAEEEAKAAAKAEEEALKEAAKAEEIKGDGAEIVIEETVTEPVEEEVVEVVAETPPETSKKKKKKNKGNTEVSVEEAFEAATEDLDMSDALSQEIDEQCANEDAKTEAYNAAIPESEKFVQPTE